jgi:hypothetical protein
MLRCVLLLASLLASLLAPLRAHAQGIPAVPAKSDTLAAVYVYIQAGDTVAFEAVRQDSAVLRGVFVQPDRPRVNWDHLLADGAPALLTISIYPPNAPGDVVPLQETDILSVGDSMLVTTRTWNGTQHQRVSSAKGAVPLLARSVLHTAILAWYAQQAKRDTLPVYVTGSGRTVPVVAEVRGDTILLSVDGLEIISTWSDGRLVEVQVPSQALRVVRVMSLPPSR